jgi:hypothetical protein
VAYESNGARGAPAALEIRAFADSHHVSMHPEQGSSKQPHQVSSTLREAIPDSPDLSEAEDRRLLEKAMSLATKTAYVEMREDFYNWWSDVAASGISGAEAKTDMEKRVAEYEKLMKGQGWKTTVRYAIKVADAFSGGLGLISEMASAGGEAILSTADIFADERLTRSNAPARLKVAAIFRRTHAARMEYVKIETPVGRL